MTRAERCRAVGVRAISGIRTHPVRVGRATVDAEGWLLALAGNDGRSDVRLEKAEVTSRAQGGRQIADPLAHAVRVANCRFGLQPHRKGVAV